MRIKLSETLGIEMILSRENINYNLTRNNDGESTIIIPMNLVKDKSKLNNVMATHYEQLSLSDKSGFSDFLAKCYRGEIN